jgi:hypothetical protein
MAPPGGNANVSIPVTNEYIATDCTIGTANTCFLPMDGPYAEKKVIDFDHRSLPYRCDKSASQRAVCRAMAVSVNVKAGVEFLDSVVAVNLLDRDCRQTLTTFY